MHLLIVHVVEYNALYYCWDMHDKIYRLVEHQPNLFLLCPDYDRNFGSDIDWKNEWFIEMCLVRFRQRNPPKNS